MKYMLTMLALLCSAIALHATTYNEYIGKTTKDGKTYYTHSNSTSATVPATKDQLKIYVDGVLKVTCDLQTHEALGTSGPKLGTATPNVTGSKGGGGGGTKHENDPLGPVEFDETRDGFLMVVTDLYTGLQNVTGFRSLTCGRIFFTTYGPLGNWTLASRSTYPCTTGNGKTYNPAAGIPGGWFPQYIPAWAEDH